MAKNKTHILVVDDELSMRELLEYMLNKEGYTVHGLEINKSPETAVKTLVPIITHHKKGILRHGDGSEIIPFVHMFWMYKRICVYPIFVCNRFVIEKKLFVPAFDNISGNTHNAFDEILVRVLGEFEYDDIPPFRVLNRH